MGSISGISGGGGIYQPQEPPPPSYSQLREEISTYLKDNIKADLFQALMTIAQLKKTASPDQSATLDQIASGLKAYDALQDEIVHGDPNDPKIRHDMDLQMDLVMRIEEAESRLPERV